MDPIKISDLSPVARTLFVPLAARARESIRTDAILRDPLAMEILAAVGGEGDFLAGMGDADVFVISMRARQFDSLARAFLARNLGGVVVDLGCGLDTRFDRLNNDQMTWIGIDLPEVIELRRRFLPDKERSGTIACSMFDIAWMKQVASLKKPVLFLAEGVFPYFNADAIKPMVLEMAGTFPTGELAFDAASAFINRHHNRTSSVLKRTGTLLRWDVKNPRELKSWGLCMQGQWYYFDEPEPRLRSFRWIRFIPFLAKVTGVFHFRLGPCP